MKFSILILVSFSQVLMAATDVDYTRCNASFGNIMGTFIDNQGKIHPGFNASIVNKKTDGNKEEYTLSEPSMFNPKEKIVTVVKVERDSNGNVVKINTAETEISQNIVKWNKDAAIRFATYSGIPNNSSTVIYEPLFFVPTNGKTKGKKVEYTRSVPLSKLTKADMKLIDVDGNIEEYKNLKSQWKKDQKTLDKINQGYKNIIDNAPMSIPAGVAADFKIENGVCIPTNISNYSYNTKTKEKQVVRTVTEDKCKKILQVYDGYKNQLDSCSKTKSQFDMTLFSVEHEIDQTGKQTASSEGGGWAGGMTGGMGGSGVGMGGGYGGIGMDPSLNSVYECHGLYGANNADVSGGIVGGSIGGGSTGGTNQVKKE